MQNLSQKKETGTNLDEILVGKDPSVAMLNVDVDILFGDKSIDCLRRQRASSFPNSTGVFTTNANSQ